MVPTHIRVSRTQNRMATFPERGMQSLFHVIFDITQIYSFGRNSVSPPPRPPFSIFRRKADILFCSRNIGPKRNMRGAMEIYWVVRVRANFHLVCFIVNVLYFCTSIASKGRRANWWSVLNRSQAL